MEPLATTPDRSFSGLPCHCFEADSALLREYYRLELRLLSGYMHITSSDDKFCSRGLQRRHSLLGRFKSRDDPIDEDAQTEWEGEEARLKAQIAALDREV